MVFAAFVTLLPAIPALAAPPLPQFVPTEIIGPATINISSSQSILETRGEGRAFALPDVMAVSLGVEARCATRDECDSILPPIVRRIVDAEKATLAADAEISTDQVRVNPVYGPASRRPNSIPTPSSFAWKFIGRVRATADSIALMAPVVDAGLAAGASEVWRSGFVYLGRQQHGESESVGNIFIPGQNFPLPPQCEKQIPEVYLSVEAYGKNADECVRKGAPIAEHVAEVLAHKLGSHGAAGFGEYEVRKIEPQPQYASAPPAPVTVQGFSASTSIVVKTRELDKLPVILEAGAAASALRGQIGYSLTADCRARKDAISLARAEAQDEAEASARALHMTLGKVYRVVIDSNFQPQYLYGLVLTDPDSLSKSQAEGESMRRILVPVRANVTVTYPLE